MENLEDNQQQENLKQNKEQIIQIIEPKIEEVKIVEDSFFQKFRTFFLDIAVVVIGVTLSTLFNDKINNYNQQKEVKKFLLGLKADFDKDIEEMEADKMGYRGISRLFTYIKNIKKNEIISEDTIKNIGKEFLFNTIALVPNNSRYEGFKSAGKINTIDDSLQNDILDLYQEDLQVLLSSTDRHIEKKGKFIDYLEDNNIRETDSTNNLYKLLSTDKCHQICRSLSNTNEIINRYDKCINKMKKISLAIEKKYPAEIQKLAL